ncbi:hypothetical protein [Streptomyces sp. DH12]|uniref:hypothetical protein n=1 Tax=Streptomyces sp. DH12 TaxID=2857010 RepID=UPI001E5BD4CB|nr:hypothetical protein [Streptomyces sp. DH12]
MSPHLPAVAPAVTAELVAALPPRLRKRLDGGVAKLSARPVVRDGDVVRIALDDDTTLELHAPGGTVTTAEAVRCGCLLAPACLHRAAAASAAPVADTAVDTETGTGADTDPAPEAEADQETEDQDTERTRPEGPTAAPDGHPSPDAPAADGTPAPDGEAPHGSRATAGQGAAAEAVLGAAAAVLDTGTDGAGAVAQAELLRAAHAARLTGLPRTAATAVAVVNGLRAARSADPAYRLAELSGRLRDLLATAHRLPHATGAELTELRGTARRAYTPEGSLRLHGLFCEPVVTASGYAGAVTWTADAEGRLYTVSDVAPGGPARAAGAADRAVRLGDTALTHRRLSREGLAVSGATVSADGRLGAGSGVRAVRARGAGWHEDPLDRLWAVPVAEQAARALAGERHGLLFLDLTVTGTVREAAGDCLLADCGGVTVRLTAADDHPDLAYRENLRLLAETAGTPLRAVARLVPASHARAGLLAVTHPTDAGVRLDLGLDRLRRADLAPAAATSGPAAPAAAAPAAAAPGTAADRSPLHLLRRRVHQAVSGGRRMLALDRDAAADARHLRRQGLPTAADLLDRLHAAAADRGRDPFGRLLPADTGHFARSWLAAAVYADEVDRALCAAAWGGEV